MIANVEAAFDRVDFVDFQEGLLAYPRYHTTLTALGAHYGQPLSVAAAVFSALSPNNDYWGNLRSAATVLRAVQEGWEPEEITVSTYRAALARALRFANGEDFMEVTKGLKTRAFYRNIMDPWDTSYVTIDGHMVGLWRGERITMKEVAGWLTKTKYRLIESDFRVVAHKHRLIPNQLQAMLWFTWKRIHDVISEQQMGLFRQGDHWGLEVDPTDIETYPRRPA